MRLHDLIAMTAMVNAPVDKPSPPVYVDSVLSEFCAECKEAALKTPSGRCLKLCLDCAAKITITGLVGD